MGLNPHPGPLLEQLPLDLMPAPLEMLPVPLEMIPIEAEPPLVEENKHEVTEEFLRRYQ
jgi:hypothetical protein